MKFFGLLVAAIAAVLGMAFVISLVLAVPVMLLWDWLMPVLFGLKKITLMQAWGLTMLCSFLFKSSCPNKD